MGLLKVQNNKISLCIDLLMKLLTVLVVVAGFAMVYIRLLRPELLSVLNEYMIALVSMGIISFLLVFWHSKKYEFAVRKDVLYCAAFLGAMLILRFIPGGTIFRFLIAGAVLVYILFFNKADNS